MSSSKDTAQACSRGDNWSLWVPASRWVDSFFIADLPQRQKTARLQPRVFSFSFLEMHLFLWVWVLCLHVCAFNTCVQCSKKPEEGIGSHKTAGTGNSELPCGWWRLKLFITESCLQQTFSVAEGNYDRFPHFHLQNDLTGRGKKQCLGP